MPCIHLLKIRTCILILNPETRSVHVFTGGFITVLITSGILVCNSCTMVCVWPIWMEMATLSFSFVASGFRISYSRFRV